MKESRSRTGSARSRSLRRQTTSSRLLEPDHAESCKQGSKRSSERRVAQLAADDLSNKDIAQAVSVTVKTVEVHLSSVYRKLGISSRQQLASSLAGDL